MKKTKIIGIGAVVFLLLTLVPISTISMEAGTVRSPSLTNWGERPIPEDETIIWEDEDAKEIHEIGFITIKSINPNSDPTELNVPPLSRGVYLKGYLVTAYNAFGWPMFKLCARGYFFALGGRVQYVFPNSYAKVEWWCAWAWTVEDLDQTHSVRDGYGEVYAEAEFSYFIGGGTVSLWALVICYGDGSSYGDGGQL